MPERFSPEVRRKTMQAVKSKNTTLENVVAKELWKKGLRFRRNVRGLTGTPDIAIKKYKVAVFIDSCFWHGCAVHYRTPESNKEYWQSKINRNKERDLKVTEYFESHNWHLLRIWEHDLTNDSAGTIEKMFSFIKQHAKT